MTLDQRFIGREYPPTPPYEVGREKIREFAEAIGDQNPAYRDPEAARALGHDDVVAPPTFLIVAAMRASGQIVADPELGIDYSRVVHGEQRFVHARPAHPGDRLTVRVRVENIRRAAGNDIISSRSDVSTVDGEHVGTAYSTLVVRGPGEES